MRLAALLVLIRYLGKASGDAGLLERPCEAVASIQAAVAPVWRHRFEAHRAAFENGLQPVDAAIALSQTLGSTEAVGRAVPHAKLFEAEPAMWRVFHEPELSGPSAALGADEIGPRAAIREHCMSDADELLFVTEGDDAMPVLKPDRARGPQTRRGEAHEFVEESAAARVASAFRHEFKATLGLRPPVRYHYTTENGGDYPRRRQS